MWEWFRVWNRYGLSWIINKLFIILCLKIITIMQTCQLCDSDLMHKCKTNFSLQKSKMCIECSETQKYSQYLNFVKAFYIFSLFFLHSSNPQYSIYRIHQFQWIFLTSFAKWSADSLVKQVFEYNNVNHALFIIEIIYYIIILLYIENR